MIRRRLFHHTVSLALVVAACSRGDATQNADYRKQPGYVIDSLLPMDEYLRRFRTGLTEPTSLTGGASTRDGLVRALIAAVAARDTGTLSLLALTRAEFAWLYFPEHPISRPPFELPPELAWFQIISNGNKGRVRLLERLGGQPLRYRGHLCPDSSARVIGIGREYGRCRVIVDGAGGQRDTLRYFGSIFELGGRFKFVSYANDF